MSGLLKRGASIRLDPSRRAIPATMAGIYKDGGRFRTNWEMIKLFHLHESVF